MRITKTLTQLGALCALMTTTAQAQMSSVAFEFVAIRDASYFQDTSGVSFRGGSYNIHVRDGNVIYENPCIAPTYFPPGAGDPYWQPGTCPIGANGYVTAGDFDGDGLEDIGSYLSIVGINAAQLLRPFAPEGVQLIAAPPSALPRPEAGFINDSRGVFYDIQSPLISHYQVTMYDFERNYADNQRGRFDKEVVQGTYTYSFPSLLAPERMQPLSVTIWPSLDGYRKIKNQRQGLRFTNLEYDSDGFVLLEPMGINTITWQGNNVDRVHPALDEVFFSVKPLNDPTDPNSGADEDQLPLFPNFSGPQTTRVVLPSPLDQSYIIPPQYMLPGQTGQIDLEFQFTRPTNGVTTDISLVKFSLPVRVKGGPIPPPPAFPFSDPDADDDNDGFSNFEEWAFGSDHNDPSSVPTYPELSFTTDPDLPEGNSEFGVHSEVSDKGAWTFKVEKVKADGLDIQYEIQFSADMTDWQTIGNEDRDWILVDSEDEIKIFSRNSEIKGGGYFRTKVTKK